MYTLFIIAFTIYGSGMIMQPFILPLARHVSIESIVLCDLRAL